MIGAVGVVGGGRMGAGIAHVFSIAGFDVTVVEESDEAQASAEARIRENLARARQAGTVDSAAHADSRVSVVGSVAGLDPASVLVIEAVPEDPDLKARVLSSVAAHVSDACVIATNTSSISIDRLATGIPVPERFIGLHFFNPVPTAELVEVVVGTATTAAVVNQVREWAAGIGKTEIVVNDSPGFATSRLGVLLGLEAIRMVEEGVGDAEAIDRAMVLGYRHAMGPLRSTDLVGLDVRLAIAEYLETWLGPRFAPPKLLREKVLRGELGRKSGQGFYAWP